MGWSTGDDTKSGGVNPSGLRRHGRYISLAWIAVGIVSLPFAVLRIARGHWDACIWFMCAGGLIIREMRRLR